MNTNLLSVSCQKQYILLKYLEMEENASGFMLPLNVKSEDNQIQTVNILSFPDGSSLCHITSQCGFNWLKNSRENV